MARVVLGLPMYNSEEYLEPVVASLLGQDFADLAVVAIDDGSSDRTLEIARRIAAADPRFVVDRNPERLGMIPNWNRTLERAYALHPDLEFFAFASDNDLRDLSWISVLVRALESEPAAALAYSRFGVTDDPLMHKQRWLFDTREIADPVERQRATTAGVRAGPVMYGLHRRATLERAGFVPEVLLSDVLFLSHLALYGTFVQTDEVLWYRGEQRTGWSSGGQRRALFATAPRTAYLPVSFQHALWLVRNMVGGDLRPADISRGAALYVSLRYLTDWWLRHVTRLLAGNRRWLKKRRKRAKKLYRRARSKVGSLVRAAVRRSAWRRLRRRVLRRLRLR